jgi:hypothetical protein
MVEGTVVNRYGQPVPGARVRLGEGAVATTDAAGRFRLSLPGATYDAAVVVDQPGVASGGPTSVSRAVVYRGLTRRDPTLYVPTLTVGLGPRHSTPIGVAVSGAPAGTATTTFAWVDNRGIAVIDLSGAPKYIGWYGDATHMGKMVAIVGPGNGGPFAISAAGNLPMTLTADQLVLATVPVTVPAAELTVAGTARPPAGCSLAAIDVNVPGETNGSVNHTVAQGPSSSQVDKPVAFSIPVGFTNELPLSLTVSVLCPSQPYTRVQWASLVARRLSPTTTSFNIDVPAPPQIVVPLASGSATVMTPFSWTAPAGAVSDAHLEVMDPNMYTLGTLDIITVGTSTRFPDLSSLRAVVVPANSGGLTIEAWGGLASTDAAAAPSGFGAIYAGVGDFSRGLSYTLGVPF